MACFPNVLLSLSVLPRGLSLSFSHAGTLILSVSFIPGLSRLTVLAENNGGTYVHTQIHATFTRSCTHIGENGVPPCTFLGRLYSFDEFSIDRVDRPMSIRNTIALYVSKGIRGQVESTLHAFSVTEPIIRYELPARRSSVTVNDIRQARAYHRNIR